MKDLIILCPYCNAHYTTDMLETLDLCEGSYTPDCCSSRVHGNIDIYCKGCKKLVYRKEVDKVTNQTEEYDQLRWKGF